MKVKNSFSYFTTVAIEAALQAGEILRRGFGQPHTITVKSGKQNIVTECDKLAEECIISTIRRSFPTHNILAEESGISVHASDAITWLIDPLDGTSNFSRHLPLFTVSIAAYKGTEGLCGVIFQPMTHELFIAEKGHGAYLNDSRISVSTISEIDEALLGTGFSHDIAENGLYSTGDVFQITQLGATVRNLGSAALALAYVAAGKLDGFWLDQLYLWDIAAGQLLIEEAGGKITRYGNTADMHLASGILATNANIHQKMRAYLKLGIL